MSATDALPPGLVELLDGTDLQGKVGITLIVSAAEVDGWPRLALLSVGEVLALSPAHLRLALYPRSGTTRALEESGRGLLSAVLNGAFYKARLSLTPVQQMPEGSELRAFDAQVVSCDEDRVGYARVQRGIEFELVDEQVLSRWQRQIAWLRGAPHDE